MSTNPPQTVDVTGLPPRAVRHVQELADQLRAVYAPDGTIRSHRRDGETAEEWQARFMEWVNSHVSRNPNFDDSRDSIYD